MKKKVSKIFEQVFTYSPLAGIIGASFLKLSNFQHQLLMLFLLVWANAFFLYKSWASQ
ncbi:MAG: hypothetical protein HYZ25_13355 [Chloroflexi bacterium]|nr:hypothetical protein [Chloroflexota bacterium]